MSVLCVQIYLHPPSGKKTFNLLYFELIRQILRHKISLLDYLKLLWHLQYIDVNTIQPFYIS